MNLDKTRIKSEADIQVAERELKALTDDEKSDLGAIEAKLKQSEDLQVKLRMTSIKTRRDVLALLTPEQRAKEKAEHEKMMQQHQGGRQRQRHGESARYHAGQSASGWRNADASRKHEDPVTHCDRKEDHAHTSIERSTDHRAWSSARARSPGATTRKATSPIS